MIKVKGYIAKYSEPGYGGLRFSPGCFDSSKRNIIIVENFSRPSSKVGDAKLYINDEGAYIEGILDETRLRFKPKEFKSFGFYGIKLKFNKEHPNSLLNVEVLEVMPSVADIKTSTFEYEEMSENDARSTES